MTEPALVILDWDGTLSDSRQRIVDCFRLSLRKIGAEVPEDDQVIAETIGLELIVAASLVMPGAGPQRCAQLVEAYRDHWLAPEASRAQLFAEALPCLGALAQRGVVLAVATGKSRRGLSRELQETGIADRFAITRTADETKGKPDPRMVHEILAHTGVAPQRAVMVGDTTFDLEMARNADVPAVAIASGTHSEASLRALAPLGCLPDLAGLPSLLFPS